MCKERKSKINQIMKKRNEKNKTKKRERNKNK